MKERSVVFFGAVVGAALGGLAGYLFLTDSGRRLRRELEPRLDQFARDLASLQESVARAGSVASQGWQVVSEVTGRQRDVHSEGSQSAPF